MVPEGLAAAAAAAAEDFRMVDKMDAAPMYGARWAMSRAAEPTGSRSRSAGEITMAFRSVVVVVLVLLLLWMRAWRRVWI